MKHKFRKFLIVLLAAAIVCLAVTLGVYLGRRHHHHGQPLDGTLDPKLARAEACMQRIVVAQDGTGQYLTITDALNSIPIGNACRMNIQVKAGVYNERIEIPKSKPFITLEGEGRMTTMVVSAQTASDLDANGTVLGTFHSATMAISSHYFKAKDITFENSAPIPTPGSAGRQAVALRISGNKAAFYRCGFLGAQDTLYDHGGVHYFERCFIQGSIDFIFGAGTSIYRDCHLHSVATLVGGSITAQKRGNNSDPDSGFVFDNCRLTGTGSVYLGRAWGDQSRVIFASTYMDSLVLPVGWVAMDLNQTLVTPVFYGQYNCEGPGANTDGRFQGAKALSPSEVQPYISTSVFIQGDQWLRE